MTGDDGRRRARAGAEDGRRGAREQLRAARRRRATRSALIAGGATVLVAAVIAFGTLVAGGAIRFGGDPATTPVASTGTPSTPPTATPSLPAPSFTPAPTEDPVPPPPPPPPAFDRAALSIDDPTSPWFVVNKLRPIPDGANYSPPDLVDLPGDMPNPNGYQMRADAAASLDEMFHAALAEIGVQLVAQSGYRDYGVQVRAYDYYVNQLGTAGADLTSARPGFSEHQTGMAMDLAAVPANCSGDQCFGQTDQGLWLAARSWEYGFVIRYPDGYTPITGYEYEPWHVRYVGVPLATEMRNTGVMTLEEMFGLAAAPTY